jgi:hypothetical protein
LNEHELKIQNVYAAIASDVTVVLGVGSVKYMRDDSLNVVDVNCAVTIRVTRFTITRCTTRQGRRYKSKH